MFSSKAFCSVVSDPFDIKNFDEFFREGKHLRRVVFDARAGSSNLAKSLIVRDVSFNAIE